ncbi:MAG TPA: TadE family protein [Anaerolineales bacterium]
MKAKRTTSSRRPNERGQSLVELAISLTVMLLLLAGAVTFGMALFSYVAMRDAAQEGALWGSFNPFHSVDGTGIYKSTDPVNKDAICARVIAASKSPVDMSSFTCDNTQNPPPLNNIDVRAIVATSPLPNPPTLGSPCEGAPTGGSGVYAVQVTVTYSFPVFMPFVGAMFGDHIPLTAQVTDTILEPKCP